MVYLAAIVLVRFCSASAPISVLWGGIVHSSQCLVIVKFVDLHCFRSYDQQWHKQVRKDPDYSETVFAKIETSRRVSLNAMPHRFRIPDTEPPFTLHISLPHDQDAPGESLATVIIHAMDFTLKQLANGEGFDFVSRAGIAFNDEIVDLRARSQLPPLQAISYASLGRILRVIWDLCKQSGYRTWKFDIFVEQGPREILVGSVALHNDL